MRKVNPVKHDEKRQEILDVAEQCFIRGGFQGTSIAQICAAAHISPGHLYHYFDSKEAIIDAIADLGLEKATCHLETMMQGPNALDAISAQIEIMKSQPQHAGNILVLDMLAEAGRNPAMAKIVQKQSRKICVFIADLLRRGQACGHVEKSLDADVTANLLLSLMDGTKGLAIRGPKANRSKCLEQFKVMLTRFLAPCR
jgi:TetR/AcrR family transcriptional repressor of uid operon